MKDFVEGEHRRGEMHPLRASQGNAAVVIFQPACAADFGRFAAFFETFSNLVEERSGATSQIEKYDANNKADNKRKGVDVRNRHG